MIRTILSALYLLLFLLLSLPILGVQLLTARRDPEKAADRASAVIRFAMRGLLFLAGTKVTLEGEEELPEGPVLFVGNHRSYFDFVCLFAFIERRLSFIGKKELGGVPVVRRWLFLIRGLLIDRTDPRKALKTILAAIDHLKNGVSVVIFPEGTRSEGAEQTELLPFHEGSLKPAIKAGCPVVPVALSSTADIFERHAPFLRKQEVRISFLKPIMISELTGEDKKYPGAYVRGLLIRELSQNRKERNNG